MKFLDSLSKWYLDGKPTKSYLRERENGGLPCSRYILLLLTFFVHLFLGTDCAWGTYCKFMQPSFGKKNYDGLPAIYNMNAFMLGVSNIFTHPLMARFGAKKIFAFGVFCYIFGYLLLIPSLIYGELWLAYIAFGVFVGIAEAYVFVCPSLVLQEYFPDKRGLASSVSTGGYAAGMLLGTYLHKYLLELDFIEKNVWLLFLFVAIVYGSFMIFTIPFFRPTKSAQVVEAPAHSPQDSCEPCLDSSANANTNGVENRNEESEIGDASSTDISDEKLKFIVASGIANSFPAPTSVFKSLPFIFTSAMFALGAVGYMLLVPNVSDFHHIFTRNANSQIGGDKIHVPSANFIFAGLCVANFAGRIISGFSFDKLLKPGSSNAFLYYILANSLNVASLALFMVSILTSKIWYLVFSYLLTGLSYGISFGTLAGALVALFGDAFLSSIFSIFFAAWAFFSLVTAFLLNYLKKKSDKIDAYQRPAITFFVISILGLFSAVSIHIYLKRRNSRFLLKHQLMMGLNS